MRNLLITMFAAALCVGLFAHQGDMMLEITGFVEESNLQTAGALVGDIITHYNGEVCSSVEGLGELKEKAEGDVEVLLQRGDEQLSVTIPAGQLGVQLRGVLPDHEVAADAVRVESVGRLGWDLGMENSFHGCVFRIEERFGRGLSYTDILGLSGYAFRFHVFSNSLCPSAPDATCGYDTGHHILGVLGYNAEALALDSMIQDEEFEPMSRTQAELEDAIYGAIDDGWPTIAIDLIETPEWGIVTGYQKDGEEMFCRTYFDHTRDYELAEKFPWFVVVLQGYEEKPLDDAYRGSLVLAREMMETEKYKDYHSGLAGFDRWIERLEAISEGSDNDKLGEEMHANWWMYVSLSSARYFAVDYLQNNADKFGLPVEDIEALAGIYDREFQILTENYEYVPSEMTGNSLDEWTDERRAGQIKMLQEIKKLELQALEILRKA